MVLSRLPVAPVALGPRLTQAFIEPPAEGARQLAGLVEEVYDLVEAALPAVDVARLREIFRYRRPAWDERPPDLDGLDPQGANAG